MNLSHKGTATRATRAAIGVLGAALIMTAGASAWAQAPAPVADKSPATGPEKTPKTYRLTYTIVDSDGAKHLGTQHYSLTVNPGGGGAHVKLGSRVPIATGSYNTENPANAANVQYQYVDVGLNISSRVHEYSAGVEVYSEVEQSSVAEEKSTVGSNDPVIRQAKLENTATLTLGKPVKLGALDVPGSTRHLDIELTMEAVD